MEVANAASIVEQSNCFFRYDKQMDAYCIYVGLSWAYIRPDKLKELEESKFKVFLLAFMQQDQEDSARIGGPTKH